MQFKKSREDVNNNHIQNINYHSDSDILHQFKQNSLI